ncbi:MAG: DUF6364 family protein [Cyclobacteriaceae bacterium]
MKNVTLSIPEDLLKKSRNYAKEHQTTLNEMVRNLLRKTVSTDKRSFIERLEEFDKLSIDTTVKFNREELHDR